VTENRRTFLRTAAGVAAASYQRVLGANDRIRLAGIGTANRGGLLMGLAAKAQGTEFVAFCDVYEPRRKAAKEKFNPSAEDYVDYRQVLDRKDIDAVIVATPDHWHVPIAIDAVEAGKDVYVEKPVSHSIEDGDRLLQAMAGSKRVLQVGYQQRSWDHFKAAREIVASGKLGKITLVLVSWYQDYYRSRADIPEFDVSKLDWKKFLGTAPDQPFVPLRFQRWRWFWDFGGGHLTDLYSHYGDVVHWCMDSYSPIAAQAMGARLSMPEYECPDTLTAIWEYPGFNITHSGALHCALDAGNIVFRGSNALMKLNRDGFAVYAEHSVPYEKTFYPEPTTSMKSTGDGTPAHMQNFLDCVRSRKTPNANVEIAVASSRAAHLGNLAYRRGARVQG
jgi:predicted dehydrogenase